jgi:FkbM family methyltransferase
MIFGRRIERGRLIRTGLSFVKLLMGLKCVRRPLFVLWNYLNQTSPRYVDLRSGHRFYFSSHPHDLVTFCLVFLKQEYGEIQRGDIVFDIGANIGSFAIYAALAGAEKVYAFEPSFEAFQTLSRNIQANHLADVVIPINKAVTGRSGDLFRFPLKSSPFNTMVASASPYGEIRIDRFSDDLREHALATAASHGVEHKDVLTISLGDFMAQESITYADLLKMDCEGAELLIVPALTTNTMKRIGKIRMECHVDPNLLIDSFRAGSHTVERLNGETLWLVPSTETSPAQKRRSPRARQASQEGVVSPGTPSAR